MKRFDHRTGARAIVQQTRGRMQAHSLGIAHQP